MNIGVLLISVTKGYMLFIAYLNLLFPYLYSKCNCSTVPVNIFFTNCIHTFASVLLWLTDKILHYYENVSGVCVKCIYFFFNSIHFSCGCLSFFFQQCILVKLYAFHKWNKQNHLSSEYSNNLFFLTKKYFLHTCCHYPLFPTLSFHPFSFVQW